MHLVIDSNQLQTPLLRQYLSDSKSNHAVITDFLGIEGYNGDPQGEFRWMEVLADFPSQVVVLHGSTQNMKMSGRPSGLIRRLVDERTTQSFPTHLAAVRAAKAGNPRALAQVAELRRFAAEHLASMEADAARVKPAMDELGSVYTKDERSIIRARGAYTEEMLDKLTVNLFSIAALIVGPAARHRKFEADIKNTLAFRVACAMYLLTVYRTAAGGVADMKPSRLRNDFVDMTFVAYGTFFDGVLTSDARLQTIYKDVCELLFKLYGVFIVEGFNPFSVPPQVP